VQISESLVVWESSFELIVVTYKLKYEVIRTKNYKVWHITTTSYYINFSGSRANSPRAAWNVLAHICFLDFLSFNVSMYKVIVLDHKSRNLYFKLTKASSKFFLFFIIVFACALSVGFTVKSIILFWLYFKMSTATYYIIWYNAEM
jgi:hypothetical protein